MDFLCSLKDSLSSFLQGIGDQLKAAYEKSKDAIDKTIEFFKSIYEKFKAAVLWAWNLISSFFSNAGELAINKLRYILNAIKGSKT
jgi:hypothetical protein